MNMLREEPTRDELKMVVRDQQNVIEATLAAQMAQQQALVAAREQRDRALDTIDAMLDATKWRAGWKNTMLIKTSMVSDALVEWASLLAARRENE